MLIRAGVIGYGYSAKTFHLPFIETSGKLEFAAISTSQPDAVKAKYPHVSIFGDADDLIAGADVDLVIITAPNHAHYPLARLSLKRGLHVILEKPMVTTSAEAEELIRLAKENACVLSVYHNRRWDGDFLTLKKVLENGDLGDVRVFESHFDRFRPTVQPRWREMPGPGTGSWFDLGSHLIDQAVCLFGLPEALTARCLPLRDGSETTDYFHVLLHYKNREVILHSSLFAAGPTLRFRVEGTKGSFVKCGFDPQEDQLKSGMLPTDAGYGADRAEEFGTLYHETDSRIVETEKGCYQKYYSDIVRAIAAGGEPPVRSEDALLVMKILELAERSSRENTACLQYHEICTRT